MDLTTKEFYIIIMCGPLHISCTLSFTAGLIIIGFFDNTALFCGSRDYLYAIGQGNETAFCTLTGNMQATQAVFTHTKGLSIKLQ